MAIQAFQQPPLVRGHVLGTYADGLRVAETYEYLDPTFGELSGNAYVSPIEFGYDHQGPFYQSTGNLTYKTYNIYSSQWTKYLTSFQLLKGTTSADYPWSFNLSGNQNLIVYFSSSGSMWYVHDSYIAKSQDIRSFVDVNDEWFGLLCRIDTTKSTADEKLELYICCRGLIKKLSVTHTSTIPSDVITNPPQLRLGNNDWYNSNFLMWNRPLLDEEIYSLMLDPWRPYRDLSGIDLLTRLGVITKPSGGQLLDRNPLFGNKLIGGILAA